MSRHPEFASQHAIVIGGSMAGLLAARVLADQFDRVTICERDTLPSEAEPRKGVPQGRHAHALLARGQMALEEIFPGLTRELVTKGAVLGHGRLFSGGGYHQPFKQGQGGLFVSRPLLEREVRARLLALPNVRIIERCAVRGLVMAENGARVTGVRATMGQAAAMEEIPADLIVDASGRGSQAPSWLEAAGYPKPEVELVDVGMGYSTRLYRRESTHLDGDLFANISPTVTNPRACGMLAQEGDRWIVTLAGYFGNYPPTDEDGFLAFARQLPTSDVYEVIRTATPLSDPVSYHFPANQRRHYEKLKRFPQGFLVTGDAICSFTPIYGQGMTVAALEALALRDCLANGPEKLAQRFFPRASRVVDTAWTITVGNDARLAGAPAARTPAARLLNGYLDRVQRAARHDPRLAIAFFRVANLIDPPSALLRPSVALGLLRRPRALSAPVPSPAPDPAAVLTQG